MALLWFGSLVPAGCGGQAAEADAPLVGGGQGNTGTSSVGSGTSYGSSTSKPSAAVCYGEPSEPPIKICQTIGFDPFSANDQACVRSLALTDDLRLNPAFVAIYFLADDGTKYVIPFVGSQADCASATSLGGWYATNVTGGDSDMGFCPCTCNAAHKKGFKLAIDCAGMPK